MFSKNKTDDSLKPMGSGTTIIAAGTTFTGDITCSNDLRIDGNVVGNIYSTSKVVIGAEGKVEGDIEGQQADVMGAINGSVSVRELLNLRGKAVVNGDIFTTSLQMEPEVTFNGCCRMNTTNPAGPAEKTSRKAQKKELPTLEGVS